VERDPQRVSAVLADPTRYAIYQFVLKSPLRVAVPEVARRFDLHPNVARMHLGKLVEIGLVAAHSEKTGKGGRPGYVYEPSGNAVSLSVPAREFQLLADLLVQSLALMGDGSKEAIDQIGRAFGCRLGTEALAQLGREPKGLEETLNAASAALQRLGVAAYMVRSIDGSANLVLRTCGFQEVASAHPDQICHLCKSMVEGITQVCMEAQTGVDLAASMPKGNKECVYEIDGLIHLE